jgi:hypothetical protein
MPKLAAVGSAFVVVAALAAPDARADTMRCDGGLVAPGDSRVDLLGKCGAPTFQDRRTDLRGGVAWDEASGVGASRQVDVALETWTYDHGPNRFVMTVVLDGGRIRSIERGGYGRATDGQRAAVRQRLSTCDGRFREGDRKHELLARCGEPASVDVWEERRGEVVRAGGTEQVVGAWVTVVHELWVYNFGPRRLVQLVVLENGVVTRVESGSYGYSD